MSMQKIVPYLWFDKEANEASDFYVKAFSKLGESKIVDRYTMAGEPPVDVVNFRLAGQDFSAMSAGPYFKINPTVSFMVNFDPSKDKQARDHLDELWTTLLEGGRALMDVGEYPFSKRYGWVQDKFGVSWQLILTDPEGDERPTIVPSLLFVGDVCGKAEEAIDFYTSVFKDARKGMVAPYPAGMDPDKEGTLMFGDFQLQGQWFAAMDSARMHEFAFSEGTSLLVNCETQEEIDYFWGKLSAVPEAEQCGWLKDKYGLSWQIVPRVLDEMMRNGTPEQAKRVKDAFMPMHKLDMAKIQAAFDGDDK